MARYGTFQYGTGVVYGRGGLNAQDQAAYAALAEPAPTTGSARHPWRNATAAIWSFDPATWRPGVKLPYIMDDANRQAQRFGVGAEQQTLTFSVSKPAYYAVGGGGAGLLSKGAYLCIQKTVTSDLGTTTFLDGVFQCHTGPTVDGAPGGSVLQITAVDWAQPTLAPPTGNGWVSYPPLLDYRTAYLAAGQPPVDYADSWATLAVAWLWALLGHRVRTDTWPQTGTTPPDPRTLPPDITGHVTLQVGAAGQALSLYDALAYFWPIVGSVMLSYDADGYLHVRDGKQPRDSGYVITTDTTVTGSIPLPWERPLTVTRQKPQYTRVLYDLLAGTLELTPPGTNLPPTHGDVMSWSRVNPHTGGDIYDIEHVVELDTTPVRQAAGFSTPSEFCRQRLSGYLGAADTIAVNVDSAVPPGPLGRQVRVHAPADDVDAWYRLESYTQPLGLAPAQWTLQWVSDAS